MASSINKVILSGRAGREPRVCTLNDGTKVCDFPLATGGEKWTTREGRDVETPTQWHNIVCWRGNAEFAEKVVKKGVGITVIGEISYRKYTDNNGVEREATDIISSELFVGGEAKGVNGSRPQDPSQYAQPSNKPMQERAEQTHRPMISEPQQARVPASDDNNALPF